MAITRKEILADIFEEEGRIETATANRDRLVRILAAEMGGTLRAAKDYIEAEHDARAGKAEPDPVAVATCCAGLVTLGNPKAPEADNADALAAYVDGYPPAVRECGEVREAVAARLAALAPVKV